MSTMEIQPDAETGRLFDLPRVQIVIDETDPTVAKLAFTGSIELDRENQEHMDFYNRLRAGQEASMWVTCHVAGARMKHRTDAEGYVDAVVQTKTLVVTDVFTGEDE